MTALIGPSGCGKSTFLRSLNRMNDLIEGANTTGTVLLDGRDAYGRDLNPVDLRRRVGIVFQKSNPFPKTVFENVAYGPRVAGLSDPARLEATVETCLRRAALWDEVKDRLEARPWTRLAASSNGCASPGLWPPIRKCCSWTNRRAPWTRNPREQIEDLIYELKRNYTIAIVTHNMQQAARVSDLTAFFNQGRLIETGPTNQMFTRPKCRQTEDYITGRFG